MNPKIERIFKEYVDAVHAKMEAGAVEHGDRSLELTLPKLLQELKQELLDLSGWAVLAWARISKLEHTIRVVEFNASRTPDDGGD